MYEPNCSEEHFEDMLFQSLERDTALKFTSVGPHRDDLSLFINGNNVRTYGSQGQQRTAALALKLAEIELARKTIHDTPVLLLDDVLSELDRNRQLQLFDEIGKAIGNRDHSTVHYAYGKVQEDIENDPNIASAIEVLKKKINIE